MDRKIDEVEFVIFDTETTGLDPKNGDRIIEIAGLRFKGEQDLGQFHSLVNPDRQVSPPAFEVNQISPEMLKDAPKMEDILPDFLDFIKGSCLCAYNMPFDLGFLNNELALAGKAPLEDFPMVDILTMSRKLFPGLERHALWFVAKALGIENKQEHRAFSDVEMTRELFRRMKSSLREKGVNEFKNFLTLFGASQKLLTGINQQKIAKIEEAIELGLKLKIKYFTRSTAQVSEREVAPKEISFEQSSPYLIGFCFLRNEERTFRIDNILDLEII
jgi:DNA polymerase III epsilon subunit family exonuclease